MATIEKYEKSGRSFYMVRYRTPEGKQTKKRGFSTKKTAEAYGSTVEVKKLTGEYVAPSLGKVTIGELGPAWLQRQKGRMKPSGFRTYDSAWRNHVEPRWAATKISDVKFTDVESWVSSLAGDLSASHVANIYSVLARILSDAAKDRLIPASPIPAKSIKLPKRSKGKNVYLTADQLDQLADESGRYRSLVLLLGTVGLRWGEAAALRVGDIDFLKRRITLHENAVTIGSTTHVGSLKTGHKRTVPLSTFVAEALAKACEGKDHTELIWPSHNGGYLGPPSSVRSWLSGAVERCIADADEKRTAERKAKPKSDPITPVFPRITAHDLRHTAASLAISAGANVLVVQRMLGHASAAMTLDTYADLFDHDLNAVADVVGKMWADRAQNVPTGTAAPALKSV
ncbi:tyrosine-type recombinase/integrase [Mycolicibacterium sp. CBM1]